MDLSVRSFYSGVVSSTTPQAYQCADHSQAACQFAHAERGVRDIFSREVRLQKTSIVSPEFADDFPPGLRVTHPAVMDRGRKNSPIWAES
jgi:hypothetical protein